MMDIDNMKQPNLGLICKQIRLDHEMSREDFAKYAGCTRQNVYYFETGRTQSLQLFLAYHNLKEGGLL